MLMVGVLMMMRVKLSYVMIVLRFMVVMHMRNSTMRHHAEHEEQE
jgi:hypothetical protein